MAVLGILSVTLEVPDLERGLKFYTDAGLSGSREGDRARFRCTGQTRDSLVLVMGARKRLHHIRLRADDLDSLRTTVEGAGGTIVEAPAGFEESGLWVCDPNGMLLHLVAQEADAPLAVSPAFVTNQPGRRVRKGQSAIKPLASYDPVRPLRLGHVLVFTPDVARSVDFLIEGLGMGLSDRSQDIIAFCCARKESDHHVLAFAKSPGVGFHHASFQVQDPDEVGRGGRALQQKSEQGDWGFGRHTIGSNFFHYIQDPWGSWFEYYSDMDYIEDHSTWQPTNYALEDSLANWGPKVPDDFIHNYEVDVTAFGVTAR